MRHIALEGRCYVIGVNPCVHIDQIPVDFPDRNRVWRTEQDADGWVEAGNSVIIGPTGTILAGPARHEETILYADIDLAAVRAARRYFDPSVTTTDRTSSNSTSTSGPARRWCSTTSHC